MRGKRGQFFILAAVILSALVVSMAVANNYVHVDKEPDKFYDRSYEMKEESLRVIDYGIFNNKERLPVFITTYVINWRNQDPEAEIVVIYGDENNVTAVNYGKESVTVQGYLILGESESELSNVGMVSGDGSYIGGTVDQNMVDFVGDCCYKVISPSEEKIIDVTINEKEYEFKLAENQQFFIIATKTLEQEEYVVIQ